LYIVEIIRLRLIHIEMKKLIIVISALAMIAVACHKKAAPTVATRTEQPPPPPTQPPPNVTLTPAYEATEIAAGKTIYEGKCVRCHAAKPVDSYTQQRWPGILRSMVPRSKLDSIETKQLTAYVMTNAKKS
jgi:mono/diheme cytochrome c family protein